MTIETKQLYNQKYKEDFLGQYPERTALTYRYTFYRCFNMESQLNKDLCKFNLEELEELMWDINPKTRASSSSMGRVISAYIKWAIEEGLTDTNISVLSTIYPEWFEEFAKFDDPNMLYISEEQLEDIERQINNYQDKVLSRLIFEGGKGDKLSPLSNLHFKDINWDTNEVTLTNYEYETGSSDEIKKITRRTIRVDDTTLNYLEKAYDEPTYIYNNGDINPNARVREMDLRSTGYILKNVDLNRTREEGKNQDKVDNHTVYRRLTNIKKWFNIPYFTPKSIEQSGMIYYVYRQHKEGRRVLNEKGEVNKKVLDEIAERYGIKVTRYSKMREYINMENISKLYSDFK